MRFLISAALAAILAAPASGQRLRLENEPLLDACERGPTKASKAFAENINAASAAFGAGDYVAALNALERARPHAQPGAQRSYIAQIEVASMIQLGGEIAAIPKLEVLVNDPCVASSTRQSFNKSLEQARTAAAAAPPH